MAWIAQLEEHQIVVLVVVSSNLTPRPNYFISRCGEVVSHESHNLVVLGSSPSTATNLESWLSGLKQLSTKQPDK